MCLIVTDASNRVTRADGVRSPGPPWTPVGGEHVHGWVLTEMGKG
ncbi:hypothetical protein ACFVW2_32075 [Streptomyces sp. NPDC058171]